MKQKEDHYIGCKIVTISIMFIMLLHFAAIFRTKPEKIPPSQRWSGTREYFVQLH